MKLKNKHVSIVIKEKTKTRVVLGVEKNGERVYMPEVEFPSKFWMDGVVKHDTKDFILLSIDEKGWLVKLPKNKITIFLRINKNKITIEKC